MKIALFAKTQEDINVHVMKVIIHKLNAEGVIALIPDSFLHTELVKLSGVEFFKDAAKVMEAEYMLSVGGDGTFLETVSWVRNSKIPVLGFNTGRLGFLANINREDTENAIQQLLAGNFEIEEKTMLQFESDTPVFGDDVVALNDFVVHKNDSSSMITVHTFLNGEFLNTYWADGVIISTATGSTGYSLSCGGPILFPGSKNFVITPISPHNLSMRPVVIPDNQVISFEIQSRSQSCRLSLDSRSASASNEISFGVRKADYGLKVVKMNHTDYLETLRRKLDWGLDRRN